MTTTLLETVQQNLGYPPLQKVDPNTQEVPEKNKSAEHALSQAAIPAVLTGLYKYVQADEGASDVLIADGAAVWTDKIFRDNKNEVVEKVAEYSKQDPETVIAEMERIAEEAIKVARMELQDNVGIQELGNYFLNQRAGILLHLPAVLKLGALLEDDTIDDRTNKMRGPISNLMQNLGGAFSNAVKGDGSNT